MSFLRAIFLAFLTAGVAALVPDQAPLPAFVSLRPTMRVNVDASLGANRPPVAAAALPGGAVAVAWEKPRGPRGRSGFFGSDLVIRLVDSEGRPHGPEIAVAGGDDEVVHFPALVAQGSDRLVVVWKSFAREGGTRIRARLLRGSGVPLGQPFLVIAQGEPGAPAVATDPSGGFSVAWEATRQDDGKRALFLRRFAASGEPLGEASLICNDCTAEVAPALASAEDGGLLALWTSRTSGVDGRGSLRARRFGPSGEAATEVTIATTVAGESLSQPASVTTAEGFVATWLASRGDHATVLLRRLDPSGRPVSSEVSVRSLPTGAASPPAIASDPAGDLSIAWTERADGKPQLRARFFDVRSGQPIVRGFVLSGRAALSTYSPVLATLGGDAFLAAWWDGDGLVRRVTLDRAGSRPHTAADVACDERRFAAILGRLAPEPKSGNGAVLALLSDSAASLEVRTTAAVSTSNGEPARLRATAGGNQVLGTLWRSYTVTLTGNMPVLAEKAAGDAAAARAIAVPFRKLAMVIAAGPAADTSSSRPPSEPIPPACGGQLSERDTLVLRTLAHHLRVSGAASVSFLVALYRGEGIDTFRADTYPLSPRGEPQGRLAAEIRVDAAEDDEGPTLTLRQLANCAGGASEGCTQVAVPVELQLEDFRSSKSPAAAPE